MSRTQEGTVRLRLWPGIAGAILMGVLWLVVPLVLPDAGLVSVLGGLLCGVLIFVWWAFFSRVPHWERWIILALIVGAIIATRQVLAHPSIRNGMMGMMTVVYGIPAFSLALVIGAVIGSRFGRGLRRLIVAAAIVLACTAFGLLRTDGITGEGRSQWAWRWSPTAEQQLLVREAAPPEPVQPAATQAEPKPVAATPPKVLAAPEWPGFRGPNRDGVVPNVRIATDWNTSPPVELWRRTVGPGWSSFALGGNLLYTQEQRGDFEVVACYNASTGKPVWTHRDAARFWESNAGPGPRATPTLHNGRVYTFGATGIVNALDARTGAVIWTRNAASDTGAKRPEWGFASSPLIVDDMIVIAASGNLVAYDLNTGENRWTAPKAGGSYSSPHLLTIGKIPHIVLLTTTGATAVAPSDGAVLWKHTWDGYPMLQPAMTMDGGLLITSGDASGGLGTRRLKIGPSTGGWTAEEVWTSRGLKPYFNDSVVHDGHAYGFDGGILSCIDLAGGNRKWKGGRYGHGQMLLLRDQNLLLILAEEGDLALVEARPDAFTEVARIPALKGKTWNHPVLVRDRLFIRNGEEMAAFRLSSESK